MVLLMYWSKDDTRCTRGLEYAVHQMRCSQRSIVRCGWLVMAVRWSGSWFELPRCTHGLEHAVHEMCYREIGDRLDPPNQPEDRRLCFRWLLNCLFEFPADLPQRCLDTLNLLPHLGYFLSQLLEISRHVRQQLPLLPFFRLQIFSRLRSILLYDLQPSLQRRYPLLLSLFLQILQPGQILPSPPNLSQVLSIGWPLIKYIGWCSLW